MCRCNHPHPLAERCGGVRVCSQGVLMLGDFWLKIWAGSEDQRQDTYIKAYAIVTGAIVFLGVFR